MNGPEETPTPDEDPAAREWADEMAMEQERTERAFGRSLFSLYKGDD